MSNEIVAVLNTETGQTGTLLRYLFENETFNNGILVEVDPHQKPYVAELYKSKVADSDEGDEDENPDTEEEDK